MFHDRKQKFAFKKENIVPFSISLAITLGFFLGIHFLGNYFLGVMWIIVAILLSLILLVIGLFAGFAVLKSLFFVAAELSLLVFLAQSYCVVPRTATSNDALKSLIGLGLLYIGVSFLRSLYNAAKGHYQKVEKEKWSKEKIFMVALYLIFAGLFMWEIYLVVQPIIINLCVYK